MLFRSDDLSTGSISNLEKPLKSKSFQFINQDVRLPFYEKVDAILNFACPASPKNYQIDPVRTIETNFLGVLNMLHLARACNAKFIQASTSEVYGDPTVTPQNEEYWGNVNPIGIRSCYDEGKRAAETLCFDYLRQYELDIRVIRIFNTYGPRIRADGAYGRALPRFVLQSLTNDDITIHGDGLQTRSFCYVTDTVTAILKCLLNKKTIATPINVGNQQETTILDLAKKIITKSNSKSKITHVQRPADDPQRRCPNITLANTLLDWKPQITLDQGLEKTIAWFRNLGSGRT